MVGGVLLTQELSKIEVLLELLFAVAKSGRPSRLKSLTATELSVLPPVAKLVAAPKLPAPLPNNTETVLTLRFATAKSGLPSRLKSPVVIPLGQEPVVKLVAAPKPPAPSPNNTEAVPALRFAVA